MASRYVALNVGQTHQDVVEGLSTNTKDVELVFDLTKVKDIKELEDRTKDIFKHLKRQKWPRPAA